MRQLPWHRGLAESWPAVASVLALYIQQDSEAERPFHPVEWLDGLDPDTVRELATMVEEVPSPDVQARVLHLAWQLRVCDYSRVVSAVRSYVASAAAPPDPSKSIHTYTRLKRAIEVGATVGVQQTPFREALAAVETTIAAIGSDAPTFLTLRLMRLLLRYRAGDATSYAAFAHAAAARARRNYESAGIGDGGECEREREYLDLEIVWRRRLDDEAGIRDLHLEVADAFVRQAEGVIVAEWPSAKSVAVHFFGAAIDRLRQVGGAQERVEELRLRQQVLQRASVAEMRSASVSLDVTDAVMAAREHVAGKPPLPALIALVSAHSPPTVADIEAEVRLRNRDTPFRALVPQSYLGPRGTVLAEHSGIADQDDATGFQLVTMRIAHERQATVATILLYAAAEQVRLEHGLDTPWFEGLARASEFVPAGRVSSFARGLAAGMRGDYEAAVVFLLPQFEHALRELFFARGVVTSTLPSSGIQNELNLNQLLEHADAPAVLGDELTFDLRVLLTEKAGANLRNDVAHGVLDDGDKIGAKIYFWWMCLYFVLVPLIASRRPPLNDDADAPPNGEPAQDKPPIEGDADDGAVEDQGEGGDPE